MTPDALPADTYSTAEAARVLNASRSWVRSQAAKGELAAFRIGSHWRIYMSAVDAIKAGGQAR